MRHARAAAALAWVAATCAAFSSAQPETARAELVGRITLIPPPGQKAGPGGTVIWLPGARAASVTTAAGPTVTSSNKRFEPHVLAVAKGTRVTFPNVDSIYHNAFSLSPGNPFDLGLYRKGASRSVELAASGLVRVYCNIHPEMAAYILVVDGDAFAVVGDDGAYRIRGVAPGRHTVQLWNEMAGEKSMTLDFDAGRSVEWSVQLDGSQYRRAPHKNKHGKDYPPATKDADRY